MKENWIQQAADALWESAQTTMPIEPISEEYRELGIPDAYAIQLQNIQRRLETGRVITGKKIGLTSKPVQEMLGVDQPDFGHLLDDMEAVDGVIQRDRLVKPRVEGEIAFVLKDDVQGPDATVEEVLAATEYVSAAIEIVDSRIRDWKIGIVDTVADNASSALYVLGDKKVDPNTIDLTTVKMDLYQNGEFINSGTGAAVLGNPAYCVAWLANALWDYGVILKKGEVILSGALSAMVFAESGDTFVAEFDMLGSASIRFE